MNLNLSNEETRDIEEVVKKLTITKEEYFLNLHKRNHLTKEVLQDNFHLRLFIEDYYHMLDSLYAYNSVLKEIIEQNKDTKVLDTILSFLDTSIKDPMVLTQIYSIYKKQNEKR